MADFDINAHLARQGFGQSKGDSESDGTNEKTTVDALFDATGKAGFTGTKLVGLPFNLSKLGSVSVTQPFDKTEGIADKQIMQSSMITGPQGGFLAKLMHDIFIKNRAVTDHTTGVGGSNGGSGGEGGGGASGGGTGSSGGDMVAMSGGSGFGDLVGQASAFEWSNMAMASLGALPRPVTPSMGVSSEMGLA